MFGVLVAWGDWKSVGIASLIGYGGLWLVSLIGEGEATFAMIFAFLFSLLVIPVLSLMIKIIRRIRARCRAVP